MRNTVQHRYVYAGYQGQGRQIHICCLMLAYTPFLNSGIKSVYVTFQSFKTSSTQQSTKSYPASILYKSIAGRYRPVSYRTGR